MQRRSYFRFLAAGGGLLAVGLGIVLVSFPRAHKLNVILVTLDTVRADRTGCYGYGPAQTPALDALAQSGVLFEKAYTPVPVTLPSHASIFTGLYPPEHGLHHNGRGKVAGGASLLAEILQKANYDTGAFVASYVLDSKFGLDRGFGTYDDTPLGEELQVRDHEHPAYRSGQIVTDAALAWLADRSTRPFFCWVHLYDAHTPYQAREEIFGNEFVDRPYDAGTAYADRQIQRLRDFLENRQLDGKTLIVVVGDHGEGLMEHQETEHGMQLYESTLRVPLVIRDPRSAKAGHRVSNAVSLTDVMPTILDCLKVALPTPVTGRSLKAAVFGKEIEPRPCYAETDVPFMYSRWAPLHAVVTERWKYIRTARPELYDLENDPHEEDNLAATAPERCREFGEMLQNLQKRMKTRPADSVSLTSVERRGLESLGYATGRGAADHPDSDGPQLPDIKDMMPHYNAIIDAKLLLSNGAAAAAARIVRNVLDKVPNYVAARVELGNALMAQENYAEAESVFASIIAAQQDFPEAYASWGNALVALGRNDEAISQYRKALQLDSSSSLCRVYLADALIHSGREGEAIRELQEAVRWTPTYVDAHLKLGGLLAQRGQIGDAIAEFEAALDFQPEVSIAHTNLGSLYTQVGDFDRGIRHATKAVAIDPESFEARYTLGAILLLRQDYRKAITEFTEACKLRPEDPGARQQLQQARAAWERNSR